MRTSVLVVLSLKNLKYNIRHFRELPPEKLILFILKAVKMTIFELLHQWSCLILIASSTSPDFLV